MYFKTLTALFLFVSCFAQAGESNSDKLTELIRAHQSPMQQVDHTFNGEGWQQISKRVAKARYVLFGESHFTREIPMLASAIANLSPFDVFYIEVDPYSTRRVAKSFTTLSAAERQAFNTRYSDLFSFFAFDEEYRLLEQMMSSGTRLLGSDQVIMWADRFVLEAWQSRSPDPRARIIYAQIIEASIEHQARFLAEQSSPMDLYFMTDEFAQDLQTLLTLDITKEERVLIGYLQQSVDIYKTRSHSKRVSLIKHHVMQDLHEWRGRQTLFKYGANHLARGESFLTVHDIGTIIANIADADFEESYHLMVLATSGMQASPFRGFPSSEVKQDGFYLAHLAPFIKEMDQTNWTVFDLVPLRDALEKEEVAIDNINLRRSIKGFDTLVLVPGVTPASLPKRSSPH